MELPPVDPTIPPPGHRAVTVARWSCRIGFATGIGTATIIALRGSNRPIVANQSLASALLFTVATALAGLALVLSVRGDGFWNRWLTWPRQLAGLPPDFGRRRALTLTVGIALAVYLVVVGRWIAANPAPIADQADYLALAELARQLGGPRGLTASLFDGTFTESNRHPLYLALLSLHPTFEFGKWLAAVFGLALVLMACGCAYARYGTVACVITAVLLAVNGSLLHAASLVACETLLALLVLIAWILLTSARLRPGAAALAGGLALGGAYLTKGSALLLALASLGSLGTRKSESKGWPVSSLRMGLLLLVGFLITAGPLLWRNVRVYGNPIHNANNRLLFVDRFDDAPHVPDQGTLRNLARYLRDHSLREIVVDRLVKGWVWETFILLRMFGPAPLDSTRVVWGMVVLGGVILGSGMQPTRGTGLPSDVTRLTLAWATLFWLFFAWYVPIAASDRFLLPLLAPLTILASNALSRAIRFRWNHERVTPWIFGLALAYLSAFAIWTLSSGWTPYADVVTVDWRSLAAASPAAWPVR